MSVRPFLLALAAGLVVPAGVAAQPFESVGIRALGMGGAFVAVADDATATYWNPAGLVTGPVFTAVAETGRGRVDDAGRATLSAVPANGTQPLAFRRQAGTLVALGTWPLGATFYRLSTVSARVVPDGGALPGASTPTALARLTTTHVGVNVLQTVVDGLHVGATVKYVYGTAGAGERASAVAADAALDAAGDLDTRGTHRVDVDAGVMLDLPRLKFGLTARNLTRPEFATRDERVRLALDRQVRAGVAVRANAGLTLSLDADLTTAEQVTGDWRSLAAGVEQRFWQDRAAVRGGVRVSSTGDPRPAVTTGASLALRSGVSADGYLAVGVDDASPDTFGLGLRVSF